MDDRKKIWLLVKEYKNSRYFPKTWFKQWVISLLSSIIKSCSVSTKHSRQLDSLSSIPARILLTKTCPSLRVNLFNSKCHGICLAFSAKVTSVGYMMRQLLLWSSSWSRNELSEWVVRSVEEGECLTTFPSLTSTRPQLRTGVSWGRPDSTNCTTSPPPGPASRPSVCPTSWCWRTNTTTGSSLPGAIRLSAPLTNRGREFSGKEKKPQLRAEILSTNMKKENQ